MISVSKEEMKKLLKKNDGFGIAFTNEYADSNKTIEEKNRGLIEAIETIMFRLGVDDSIEWNDKTRDVYQWVCDNCILALHDAGVTYLGVETSTGVSVDYDIDYIYKYKLFNEDL